MPEDLRTLKEERPAGLRTDRRDDSKVELCRQLENDLQGVLNLPESIFTNVLRPSVIAARRWSGRQNLGCAIENAVCIRFHDGAARIAKDRLVEVDRRVIDYILCRILRMVEKVEKLHAELHLDAFGYFKILVNTQVHVPRGRPGTDSNPCVSDGPQLEAAGGEHIGIEVGRRISATCTAWLTGNTIRTLALGSCSISNTRRISQTLNRNQGRDGWSAR